MIFSGFNFSWQPTVLLLLTSFMPHTSLLLLSALAASDSMLLLTFLMLLMS
jgi:hypothetical protein